MVENTRIDVVHGFGEFKPSLNNLKQGLEALGDNYQVYFHSPRKASEINGNLDRFKQSGAILFRSILLLNKIRQKSDILIIHKFIFPADNTLIERFFATQNNVIYTVYDAEYISNPNKAKFLFKNSDLVHAISHAIAAHAREYTDNIALIPPSVDTEFFTPLSEEEVGKLQYSERSDNLTIGWVGNAADHKENILFIIDVLAELDSRNDFTFRLLCGGEIDDKLNNKLTKCEFNTDVINWVPWEDVPKVINTFDVGVAPLQDTAFNRGRSSEKIREYMACGCPVVASDIGENPYLLPDSAGFLVNNKSDWDEALIALMEDSERRGKMGCNAREYVEENYSIPVIAEQLKTEIESLLSE